MPAHELEGVYGFFKNKSMVMEEFDALYVPADKGRGGKPACGRLKRRLCQEPLGNLKILFAGYKGCGKSTELLRLQKQIDETFVVIGFSVMTELDILNISYIELFIATMERLFAFIDQERAIEIDQRYLDNIRSWLRSKEIEEVTVKHLGAELQAGVDAKVDIPFLAKFFGKFKAAAKSSTSVKETLKTKVEPKISDLIFYCNQLIREIKNQVGRIGKQGLVLVVEDMDKIDVTSGSQIFYDHSTQLTQLDSHCIFTFPIALLYHHKFTTIRNNYDESFVLPMIKVREKDGADHRLGIRVMETIVERRMSLDFFEDREILRKMIRYSGGCLWDFFRMIKEAADNALDDGDKVISWKDFNAAYKSLKAEYRYTIAENREKGFTVDDYYAALARCADDPSKKPDPSEIMLDLRNNLTVLNYNGDEWEDVHPLVKDLLADRKAETDGV